MVSTHPQTTPFGNYHPPLCTMTTRNSKDMSAEDVSRLISIVICSFKNSKDDGLTYAAAKDLVTSSTSLCKA